MRAGHALYERAHRLHCFRFDRGEGLGRKAAGVRVEQRRVEIRGERRGVGGAFDVVSRRRGAVGRDDDVGARRPVTAQLDRHGRRRAVHFPDISRTQVEIIPRVGDVVGRDAAYGDELSEAALALKVFSIGLEEIAGRIVREVGGEDRRAVRRPGVAEIEYGGGREVVVKVVVRGRGTGDEGKARHQSPLAGDGRPGDGEAT